MRDTEHSFAIVAATPGHGVPPMGDLHIENAFASVHGERVHIEFSRIAPSIEEAVSVALDEVLKIGLKVIRVDT
ncbi:hypothetical protein D3C71_324370 [compost metagenome]